MRDLHVWIVTLIVGLLLLVMQGCSCDGGLKNMSDDWCDKHDLPPLIPSQSWDQENLKRNDHGCPTAIYVAPNGNLEQCL